MHLPPVGSTCPHCGELAPHGDGRIPWLQWHIENPLHAWWWAIKRRTGRLLCWFNRHKHPKEYAPAYWECERPDCDVVQRQKWW